MAKLHLDRIKRKYGYKGERYRDLMEKIITNNSENVSRAISRLSEDHWNKALKKVKPGKRFILPDINEVLPKRSVFIRKGAEQGRKITDNLRDKLTADLRKTMDTFTTETGEQNYIRRRGAKAGTINPKLVDQFESRITKTFKNYTKKDPRIGVPANVREIAVTEVRGAINPIKNAYAEELALKNPKLKQKKTWNHNPSLSRVPRKGHKQMNGKSIKIDKFFNVPLFVDIRGKLVKITTTLMKFPHDPTAPPEQIIGCHCDIEYSIVAT